uniref:DDE-1 domain-containing protein n=1 Tax=Daphnia galeata TaxID=27404 RepID=A0A8J2RJT3_9CRUS|nr:unnamed protein product [Daphnia galeata]
MIFTADQEKELVAYITKASDMYFGLGPMEVRKLAFSFATFLERKMPKSWESTSAAGKDWFGSFIKRNPSLSIRKPESTSLARASSFNQYNVDCFFNNLDIVLAKYKLTPLEIWNERGTLVTLCMAVSAVGNSVPPFFVFTRVHMKDDFLVNASLGSCGSANKSGWMTEKDFVLYLQHFVKHARPSLEKPVLLLLDNHGSHLSVEGLNYAKTSTIGFISVWATETLCQRSYRGLAQESSRPNNDIPGIVKEALPSAITPRNIMAGFQKAGVAAYNRNIFTEDDFAPSMVTNRPNQNHVTSTAIETATTTNEVDDVPPTEIEFINLTPIEEIPEDQLINAVLVQPGSSSPSTSSSSSIGLSSHFSADGSVLENLRPLPKAGPRKTAVRVSRQRKTAILTSTPVKDMLEKEKEKTAERATKKLIAQQRKATKKLHR